MLSFALLGQACISKNYLSSKEPICIPLSSEDSGLSMQTSMESALSSSLPIDTLKFLLGPGVISIGHLITLNDVDRHIIFEGNGQTRIHLSSPWLNLRAKETRISLQRNAERNEDQIKVHDEIIDQGSLIALRSEDIVESAWSYKQTDVVQVDRIERDIVFLEDSLNFSYKAGNSELKMYSPASVTFRNIHFELALPVGYGVSLRGMGVTFKNCSVTYAEEKDLPVFASLYDCSPVQIIDCDIYGNITYGFLMNSCSEVYVKNIISEKCIHPLVPAYWTSQMVVDGFKGKGSVIDAHPSLDVTYKNVQVTEGLNYWNCRALGVKLIDCDFEVLPGISSPSLYIGVLALNKDYEFMYDEYDVLCSNVKWKYKDQGFNGLHVHKCRDFMVENCETHEVSTGAPIQRFEVINSRLGRLACADSNFKISGCVFRKSWQNTDTYTSPLSCSYDGTAIIENCAFFGYDDQYLFNYIQSTQTRITFRNCDFNKLKGFVRKSYQPKSAYKEIKIYNPDPEAASNFRDMPNIKVQP